MASTSNMHPTVKDIPHQQFIQEYSKHLKNIGSVKVPSWIDYVKSASFKQLPPRDEDWFYIRMASIIRLFYIHKNLGVGWLSIRYGGNKNKGSRPSHKYKASTNVLRKCIKELERLKFIKLDENDSGSSGRSITTLGKQEIDSFCAQLVEQKQEN